MYGYLKHYGIKGQQWGVRNGPPYPIGSGTKKAMRRRRNAENSSEKSGSRTGSKVLDKAYDKIASMNQEDWDKVRGNVKKAEIIAKGAAAVAGVSAIGLAVGGAGIYLANNPEVLKSLVSEVSELFGNSKLMEKGIEAGAELGKKVISEKGEKIAKATAEKIAKGLSYEMKSGEILSTLKGIKKNASEEDYFKFIKDNWEVISRDPKALSEVADNVSRVFNDNAPLAKANTNLKNVKQAWENKNMYTEKKMNRVTKTLGYGTALAGAFTNAVGAAENLYRKKDSPMVKDIIEAGKSVVSKYSKDQAADESDYVKKK